MSKRFLAPLEMPFASKKRAILAFVYSRRFLVGILCGYMFSSVINCINCSGHWFVSELNTEATIVEMDLGGAEPVAATPFSVMADRIPEAKQVVGKRHDRILCWVLTTPSNKFKAEIVKATWGKKCDKLLFMSSVSDTSLPAVGLPVGESRSLLWEKVKLSVRYLYAHHLNEFDWFFKADDDTYTIFENMRRLLFPFNSSVPYFLGREFRFMNVTYHSGGSGYVLSREALRRIVERGFDSQKCQVKPNENYEDVNMGRCVKEVDGIFGDSRDELGLQRFIPYKINEFFTGEGEHIRFLQYNRVDYQLGYNCCSSEAVAFHYVSGYDMQVYEYLLYRLNIANMSLVQ